MSNAISSLQGISASGFASVSDAGLRGMITLRADLASKSLAAVLKATIGTGVPAPRRITFNGEKGVGWMSPDELLVLVPYSEAAATVLALATALRDEHALVLDVSDARAVFRIVGKSADQVLRKLSPADFDVLASGELRRTRVAQVAGAFWRTGPDEITLVTFRSVAAYVFGILAMSARPGSELN